MIADVLARWHKLKNNRVFFLTGTDEFGQKIAQAAEKAGKQPQEFVDSFIDAYKKVWRDYEIKYDIFMRTTNQISILKRCKNGFYSSWKKVIFINHSMKDGIARIVKHLLLNMKQSETAPALSVMWPANS